MTKVYDGLIGTIVVTKEGMARSVDHPHPKDVDQAFTTLFMVFDENGRKTIKGGKAEMAKYELSEAEAEAHLKYAINGFIFGNFQGLEVKRTIGCVGI